MSETSFARSLSAHLSLAVGFVLVGAVLFSSNAGAQPTVVEIIDANADAVGNLLGGPAGLAVDASGTVYVAGLSSDNVFQVAPGGVTQMIDSTGDGAGNGLAGADGIAVDGAGNVYVSGAGSDNVFRIARNIDGTITISQILDATGDGAGHALATPRGVAVDADGNVYVAGSASDNVFKISSGGAIQQILDATGDGMGNVLDGPVGVAVDAAGNVYVTGSISNNVFQVTPAGVITQIVDNTGDGGGNGLDSPQGIAVDGAGNVYVAGAGSDNVLRVASSGAVTQILDSTGDGAGNSLASPQDVAVDTSGNVYVAASNSHNAFEVASDGTVKQVIDVNGDGGGNVLSFPRGTAVDVSGNAFVGGFGSNNVFEIKPPVPDLCSAMPKPSCLTGGRATLVYDETTTGKERMKVRFKKVASATTQAQFGDPVSGSTNVALCLYDDAGGLLQALVVDRPNPVVAEPSWKSLGAHGYDYKDRIARSDGVSKIRYLAGVAGKGKASVRGKNNSVTKWYRSLPTGVAFKLSGNTAPTIQVVTSDGFCLGATMNRVKRNEVLDYRAEFK